MKYYFVYIMTNEGRSTIYIGFTNDLAKRVYEHQQGEVECFTKDYRLSRLVYYEVYPDVHAAIVRGKQLKGWLREKKNALIEHQNPNWDDLSPQLYEQTPEQMGGSSTPLRSAQNDKMESAA